MTQPVVATAAGTPATVGAAGGGQARLGAAPAGAATAATPLWGWQPGTGRASSAARLPRPSSSRSPRFWPQVSGLAKQLEEWLLHLYGLHNELIQERVQELEEVMERVAQAKAELRQICCTVEAAYRELCLQPEA